MNKKTKIIVSVVVCLIIIGAIAATVASYVATSKIAKKIESEYNSAVSLLTFGGIKAGEIKCSGGMSVNCAIDNITMSSYKETMSINDIKINLKGSKTRAKIAFGFDFNYEKDPKNDFYTRNQELSFINNSHISCEYEGKLIAEKSLLKNDLLCQVKDANKNIYTYSVNTNNIGEIFKDTDFVKLTSAEDKYAVLSSIDSVDTYLNSINFKTKIVNDNNLIDGFLKDTSGNSYERAIEELKNIEKNEDYNKASEEEKQLFLLAKEFLINNHKNINIKLDAIEENKVEFENGDLFGIEYLNDLLMVGKFEGVKLTTSAK